ERGCELAQIDPPGEFERPAAARPERDVDAVAQEVLVRVDHRHAVGIAPTAVDAGHADAVGELHCREQKDSTRLPALVRNHEIARLRHRAVARAVEIAPYPRAEASRPLEQAPQIVGGGVTARGGLEDIGYDGVADLIDGSYGGRSGSRWLRRGCSARLERADR